MKKFIDNLRLFVRRIIQVNMNAEKQELAVWNNLKKLHSDSDWKCGVYEKDKFVETHFEIANEKYAAFFYIISDLEFHCRVKIIENFPVEITSDIFILASHFNNLIKSGRVEVNVTDKFVAYNYNCDLLVPLIYNGEIHRRMLNHYNLAKDIYWAFDKLIVENEAPAIIISDLLKKIETKEDES